VCGHLLANVRILSSFGGLGLWSPGIYLRATVGYHLVWELDERLPQNRPCAPLRGNRTEPGPFTAGRSSGVALPVGTHRRWAKSVHQVINEFFKFQNPLGYVEEGPRGPGFCPNPAGITSDAPMVFKYGRQWGASPFSGAPPPFAPISLEW
jgi:hypothetical protein